MSHNEPAKRQKRHAISENLSNVSLQEQKEHMVSQSQATQRAGKAALNQSTLLITTARDHLNRNQETREETSLIQNKLEARDQLTVKDVLNIIGIEHVYGEFLKHRESLAWLIFGDSSICGKTTLLMMN